MFPDLRPCPHCRHQISPYKCYCPKCGQLAPDPPNRARLYVTVIAVVAAIAAGIVLYVIANRNTEAGASSNTHTVRVFNPN